MHLVRHHGMLPDSEITTIKGLRTSNLVRTLVDCLLDLPATDAFVVGDSLLRIGTHAHRLDRERVERTASRLRVQAADLLRRRGRRHNSRRARLMLGLLSPWSESPGESEMRFLLLVAGTPEPTLQHQVTTGDRQWFIDAAWPHALIGLEFDGRGKYAGSADTLYREKRRQEHLERRGWTILRVGWPDLKDPELLISRVLATVPAGTVFSITPRTGIA